MNQNLQPKIQLNNGLLMPQVGLGVWKTPLDVTRKMVSDALANGYVLLDTAKQYGNESAVGQGMQDVFNSTGRTRQSIFLTTKIYNGDQGSYDRVRKGFEGQLKALQTDYVDLLLMHWPVNDLYNQTWQAMEKIYANGQAKAIGVCNFNVERMSDLLDHAKITPAINQIEFNPKIHQPAIVNFCQQHGIQMEAWSPLGNGRLLHEPIIEKIAHSHQKKTAQIELRWAIQHDLIVIPKTTHPDRMKENADIFDFDLSPEECIQIDSLDTEEHAIWYDKFKWSGNPDGIDNVIADPESFR
ncbi:aldo/keto reductase [Limosilactobacillus pulli]|uniref:aldo/keto reductase n=1 Tax=Limosilactobacillus pulli TaxID=2991833 RepID=UPI0024BA71A2|nr:aldo/keto reductase [Limosilactobacillus pulli]